MKTCPNGQEVKFVINTQVVELEASADKTILETVREFGYTGTKEGCASGDCGACTVMVGEITNGDMQYRTVNACIAPIGQQSGRHIVTVEGLESHEALHPAQSEMVNCHGSQCGFCTPGFVVSLAALVEQGVRAERDHVLQGISGNLCRCTGYRPIVDAGMAALRTGSRHDIQGQDLVAHLEDSVTGSVLQPTTESALQQAMAEHPDARLIAGGTDLMLDVTQRYDALPRLIDVTRVQEMKQSQEKEGHLIIGSAVPYTELETLFADKSEPFLKLLYRLGSRQIRNSGTLGGNLANGSPIADTPPVLISWDALVELADTKGASRTLSVTDFYRGYRDTELDSNQYIARVHIPLASLDSFHRIYKSSKRLEDDISSVLGAFRFTGTADRVTDARIAYGGMAATPVRLQEVETLLCSAELNDVLIQRAVELMASMMSPLTDVRASAEYRSAMAATMLERALAEYMGSHQPVITEVAFNA